jgi:ABC-2 type transport system permease protein
MQGVIHGVRTGVRRGLIEWRQTYRTSTDLWNQVVWPLAMCLVLFFMRDAEFAGFPLAMLVLPSIMGMTVVFGGILGTSAVLSTEREDGTLLRAKVTPNGMVGYLVGKVVMVTGWIVVGLLVALAAGIFFVDGLVLGSAGTWLTVAWVVLLGALATFPIGAIIGALLPHPRMQGLIVPWLGAVVAVSGIFYPLAALPVWLQNIGQVFPVYWLGLGVRSALLPDAAAAVEVTGTWRHLETVGVLGAWAIVGLALAPIVLRRMARRESGSILVTRREKALQRIS